MCQHVRSHRSKIEVRKCLSVIFFLQQTIMHLAGLQSHNTHGRSALHARKVRHATRCSHSWHMTSMHNWSNGAVIWLFDTTSAADLGEHSNSTA